MAITISGSTGIAGVDGSAGTPAIQGTDTNTGISFPAGDVIAFNEGGSEAARFDASSNLLVGTTSTPTSMTNAVVNKSTARAWIKLTDNGTTVTTNASFNISSVTRTATGNYVLNFTAAMSVADYCVVGAGGCNSTSMRAVSLPFNSTSPTTSTCPIQLVSADGALGAATQYLSAAIFSASY